MTEEKRKTIAMLVQGGCGDVISATPMLRAARKAYPDDYIIVLGTYTQILEGNPNIDKLIPMNDPGKIQDFYSQHIINKPVRYFKKFFPYDHIMNTAAHGCKDLRHFITKLYGFEEAYDNGKPDYFITEYEKRAADVFLTQDIKPIVLLHIYGAVPSDGENPTVVCPICRGAGRDPNGVPCGACGASGVTVMRKKTNSLKDLDPKIVAPVVEKYKGKINFMQIGLSGEPLIPGVIDCLGMPLRDTINLFAHPQVLTGICIESLFMHAAAAVEKPIITVFQNTDPDFFGYPIHYNVWHTGGCKDWPCNRPVGALMDFNPGYKNPKKMGERVLWECPDQKCARMNPKNLEAAFDEVWEEYQKKKDNSGHKTYEEALKSGPLKKAIEKEVLKEKMSEDFSE